MKDWTIQNLLQVPQFCWMTEGDIEMGSNLNINISNFATYNSRESQSSPQKYE
jgi:hypothetical protein